MLASRRGQISSSRLSGLGFSISAFRVSPLSDGLPVGIRTSKMRLLANSESALASSRRLVQLKLASRMKDFALVEALFARGKTNFGAGFLHEQWVVTADQIDVGQTTFERVVELVWRIFTLSPSKLGAASLTSIGWLSLA